MLAMFGRLQWRRVGAVYNNEGASAQLVQLLAQFGPTLLPGFDLSAHSYTYDRMSFAPFPDVRQQLRTLKDAGVRVILLSSFSIEAPLVLAAAAELGMVGPGTPYAWVASSQICFDASMLSDPANVHLMEGLLCAQSSVAQDTPFYSSFQQSWAEAYERDPASVFYIRKPALSANAYDAVFGAARAMQTVLNLRAQCNLSDTGGLGTDMPLSGLIPPNLAEFNPYLYSSGGGTVSGRNLTFTRNSVPTTYPAVCPWLLYQVGQGRVLNRLLRAQQSVGVTGPILLMDSGDRIGDIFFYNIHHGVKNRVATVSGPHVYALLLEGVIGDALLHLLALNISASAPANATNPGGVGPTPAPIAPDSISGNSSWRDSYDPATFQTHGHFELTSQELALQPGRSLDARVFSDLRLDAIRFADGTATVPLDNPLLVELVEPISHGAWVAVLVLTAVVGAYNLALLAFQLRYRRHKLIKITAPKMNVVFLCGSLGVLVYVVLLGLDSTQLGGADRYVEMCHAKYALLAVSFSLAFGSLFAKTYRLDAIFNSKHLHVHVVKDRDILLMVLRLIVLDTIILVVWGGESPFFRDLSQDAPTLNPLDFNQLQVPTRESCGSDNFTIYVVTFLAYKGALLAFGLYLALRVRKIRFQSINDSKWIVMSIYNVTMISVLLIPVSIVVGDDPDTFYLLVSLALLYLVTSVLSLLFLPRVLTICCNVDMFAARVGSTAVTGAGTDSRDTLSGSDLLRAEMAKLKQRLTYAQTDLNEARKQFHAAGLTLVLEVRNVSQGTSGGIASSCSPSQLGTAGSAFRIDAPSPQPRSSNLTAGGGTVAGTAGGGRTPTPSRSRHLSPATHGALTSPSLTGGRRTLPAQSIRDHVYGARADGEGAGLGQGPSPGLAPGLGSGPAASDFITANPHSPPGASSSSSRPASSSSGGEVELRVIVGGVTAPDPPAARAALSALPGAIMHNSLIGEDEEARQEPQPQWSHPPPSASPAHTQSAPVEAPPALVPSFSPA